MIPYGGSSGLGHDARTAAAPFGNLPPRMALAPFGNFDLPVEHTFMGRDVLLNKVEPHILALGWLGNHADGYDEFDHGLSPCVLAARLITGRMHSRADLPCVTFLVLSRVSLDRRHLMEGQGMFDSAASQD